MKRTLTNANFSAILSAITNLPTKLLLRFDGDLIAILNCYAAAGAGDMRCQHKGYYGWGGGGGGGSKVNLSCLTVSLSNFNQKTTTGSQKCRFLVRQLAP